VRNKNNLVYQFIFILSFLLLFFIITTPYFLSFPRRRESKLEAMKKLVILDHPMIPSKAENNFILDPRLRGDDKGRTREKYWGWQEGIPRLRSEWQLEFNSTHYISKTCFDNFRFLDKKKPTTVGTDVGSSMNLFRSPGRLNGAL